MSKNTWITGLGAAAAAALLAAAVPASADGRRHERHEDEEHEHERHDEDDDEGGRDGDGHRRGDGERQRGSGERGVGRDRATASAVLPAYGKECGSCHLAFPPNLLPASSWTKMMAGLDRHFGKNAELEPEVRAPIERWLVEGAGSARGGEASLRFTDGAWFRRKHRKVEGKVSRPSIKSLANCAACHPGAERWDFDEDGIVIPQR
jgi:hypothetical protein